MSKDFNWIDLKREMKKVSGKPLDLKLVGEMMNILRDLDENYKNAMLLIFCLSSVPDNNILQQLSEVQSPIIGAPKE